MHTSKDEFARRLRMFDQSQGHTWNQEQVTYYLGETKEEVAKRKKGVQGIPTSALKN